MPNRSDLSLWFNLAGVVAAYQPVAAPGPLLARYNQAHGGNNLYKAVDGVAPTWTGHSGWTFNGTTQYLESGIASAFNAGRLRYDRALLVRWSGATFPNVLHRAIGAHYSAAEGIGLGKYYENAFTNGSVAGSGTPAAAAVYAVNYDGEGYIDGIYQATATTDTSGGTNAPMVIGASNSSGGVNFFFNGNILAALIIERVLSAAEVWQASRQMAYCHANPDWSAWGRRRRYYYAPPEAPPVTTEDFRLAAAGVGAFGPRLGGAARMGHQQAAELPAAVRAGHRSRLNG